MHVYGLCDSLTNLKCNAVLWSDLRGIFSLFLSGLSSYSNHYQHANISDFIKIDGVVTAMISEYPFKKDIEENLRNQTIIFSIW